MGTDPAAVAADTIARERASDPGRSVLLQAPAGSGKTTVLTERLLRLLSVVEQPEEILAITFTRKAAAEMRARVLKALRGEIDTSSPQGVRMREFADAALARASARGWDLAQDPGRLRIQTIDSFNFRLATQLTVTAKAGGSLVITERPYELYNRAARETLAAADSDGQLAADVELLFERLDNNWGNVQRLLADMLRQRGHWLRYVLAHEAGALSDRVSSSLGEVARDQLSAVSGMLPASLRAEASALPGVGALGSGLETLRSWRRLAEVALIKSGEWRKPRGINKSIGPEYEHADVKDALRSVIERLSAIEGFRDALSDLASLPAIELSRADSAAIEALSRVLRSSAVYLQAEFAANGRVDHTYVAGAARESLTDGGLPTDLALRTGLSLRHILVDEFQDTSLAQFDLIEMLTVGWEEGDGRTLFVVGDPMQSIYQFREAEVGLFLRARDQGIGRVRLDALQLTRNFRSVPALIDWINEAFATVFPTEDDLRASAVSFTRSIAGKNAFPHAELPVRARMFDSDHREVETRAIIERIAELRIREPQSTIAVLVAARSHAAAVMTGLEQQGIDAVGVDLVPLRELSIIRDLVALLKALCHLGDRTSWLAVLRAPWCGLSLPTLTVLSQRRDRLLVWEAMSDEDRLAGISGDELRRVVRVREVLSQALESRNNLPLADWLELTWLRLGAADAYPLQDLRHARAFIEALSDRVTAGEGSGAEIVDSLLGDLFAQPLASGGNPVQLMTIHRAKGLEFDHVFVPSLDRELNRGREPLLRWLDLPRASGESDLIMAPAPAIGEDEGGDVSRYLKRLIARRAANEQTRLLYVAATRAKKSLELSGSPKVRDDGKISPRSGTLLASLWPVVAPMLTEGGVDRAAAAPTGADTPPTQLLRRLVKDWAPAQLAAASPLYRLPVAHQSLEPPEFSWVGETSRHIGTVVHAALEAFASATSLPSKSTIGGQRDFYIYQLRRHGVPSSDLSWAADIVVDALTRTVGTDRGRWIFAPEHRDARSEWALTGIAGGRLTNVIIDRSFIDRDGTRWVIDFKTSRHEGGGLDAFLDEEMERYRPQLETYVALVRGLHQSGETVRAGLYFPLLDAFRELR